MCARPRGAAGPAPRRRCCCHALDVYRFSTGARPGGRGGGDGPEVQPRRPALDVDRPSMWIGLGDDHSTCQQPSLIFIRNDLDLLNSPGAGELLKQQTTRQLDTADHW